MKSHTKDRPQSHATVMRLSGHLPSLRHSDAGSNMASVSADANTRLTWSEVVEKNGQTRQLCKADDMDRGKRKKLDVV